MLLGGKGLAFVGSDSAGTHAMKKWQLGESDFKNLWKKERCWFGSPTWSEGVPLTV